MEKFFIEKIGRINFVPLDFIKNLQIVSVAQAKIETFEGTGAYPITDDKTHGETIKILQKIHSKLKIKLLR